MIEHIVLQKFLVAYHLFNCKHRTRPETVKPTKAPNRRAIKARENEIRLQCRKDTMKLSNIESNKGLCFGCQSTEFAMFVIWFLCQQ